MSRIVIALNQEQIEKVLEIIKPYLEKHKDWEEFELYKLRESKGGSLHIYTLPKPDKEVS